MNILQIILGLYFFMVLVDMAMLFHLNTSERWIHRFREYLACLNPLTWYPVIYLAFTITDYALENK